MRKYRVVALLLGLAAAMTFVFGGSGLTTEAQTGGWSSWQCQYDIGDALTGQPAYPVYGGYMNGQGCISYSLDNSYRHWLFWGNTLLDHYAFGSPSVEAEITGYTGCDGINYYYSGSSTGIANNASSTGSGSSVNALMASCGTYATHYYLTTQYHQQQLYTGYPYENYSGTTRNQLSQVCC